MGNLFFEHSLVKKKIHNYDLIREKTMISSKKYKLLDQEEKDLSIAIDSIDVDKITRPSIKTQQKFFSAAKNYINNYTKKYTHGNLPYDLPTFANSKENQNQLLKKNMLYNYFDEQKDMQMRTYSSPF